MLTEHCDLYRNPYNVSNFVYNNVDNTITCKITGEVYCFDHSIYKHANFIFRGVKDFVYTRRDSEFPTIALTKDLYSWKTNENTMELSFGEHFSVICDTMEVVSTSEERIDFEMK